MEDHKHSADGGYLELDIYVPELLLGLEYQGEQHFKPIHYFGEYETQQLRDEEKRQACKQVLFHERLIRRVWGYTD